MIVIFTVVAALYFANANAFPAESNVNITALKTCFSTLKTSLGNDSSLMSLISSGQYSAAKNEFIDKVQALCPDQFEAITAFVQQFNKSIEILEQMYNGLNATEQENLKTWQENKNYKAIAQLFAEKFKTLSAEDQQILKDTFASLLKSFMQQNGSVITKFLKACTPEEKTQVEQYFSNSDFDKLDAFVKTKLDAGGFTDQEKLHINGFLNILRKKQQGTI